MTAKISALLQIRSALERTFATDDGDLLCLLLDSLDLALSVDLGRDSGSEFTLRVGPLGNGSRFSPGPGLADRERRGQGISLSTPPQPYATSSRRICCRYVLLIMHSNSGINWRVFEEESVWPVQVRLGSLWNCFATSIRVIGVIAIVAIVPVEE